MYQKGMKSTPLIHRATGYCRRLRSFSTIFFGKNDFQGFADYFSYIYCWKYLECARNVPWHFVAWFFILYNKMKYYNPIFLGYYIK